MGSRNPLALPLFFIFLNFLLNFTSDFAFFRDARPRPLAITFILCPVPGSMESQYLFWLYII